MHPATRVGIMHKPSNPGESHKAATPVIDLVSMQLHTA